MARVAMRAVAVADKHIAAGLDLQHEGEVFGAHGRFAGGVDIGFADQILHDRCREGGLCGIVDGGRIVAMKVQ